MIGMAREATSLYGDDSPMPLGEGMGPLWSHLLENI